MNSRTESKKREVDGVRSIEDPLRTELIAEHTELELLADNLLVAFTSGGGAELLGHWKRFEEKMAHHFAIEEAVLFPSLERDSPAAAAALKQAHLSLRKQANTVAARVELGVVRHQEIENLLAELRVHGRDEDRVFGRGASARLSRRTG